MPAGRLTRAFAFEVSPQQVTPFVGGVVAPTDQLQAALDLTFDKSEATSGSIVSFEVGSAPEAARTHPVRDAAMAVAFGPNADAEPIRGLAARLAFAMDRRSSPSLLMATAHESTSANRRRFLLWTFPQQDVFTLSMAGQQASLRTMEAFTRDSKLRKLALLEGAPQRNSMLTAQVVDFQAASGDRTAADFWIVDFLEARLQVGSTEGTQILARALRTAHDRSRGDVDTQEEITAAITALRRSPTPRWSIQSVATAFLTSQTATDALLNAVKPEERSVLFEVDKQKLDELIQFRRFVLNNGVVVSAPFVQIDVDGAVQISESDDGRRRLQVTGDIEEEQVRRRV